MFNKINLNTEVSYLFGYFFNYNFNQKINQGAGKNLKIISILKGI